MTLLWNDIPISPRLFWEPLFGWRDHRVSSRLSHLIGGQMPHGLLGSLLLLNEHELVAIPGIGQTSLSQFIAAVAAIEAKHGGQDVGREAIARRARALAHFVAEFNVTYWIAWPAAHDGQNGRWVKAPTFRQVDRFRTLAMNARRAGMLASTETYQQAIALLPGPAAHQQAG